MVSHCWGQVEVVQEVGCREEMASHLFFFFFFFFFFFLFFSFLRLLFASSV